MAQVKVVQEFEITETQALMHQLQTDVKGFEKLSQLLKENAGINLITNDKNLSLMASRLVSVLKKHNFTSYKKYFDYLVTSSPEAMSEFIFNLTTNTTQFFRESVHFDYLKDKLPEILEEKRKQNSNELRIWCSATSTGQEVYTIMMVLLSQMQNLNQWNIRFLATDIDLEVLQRAAHGIYREAEMQGVPEMNRRQFFSCTGNDADKQYQIKPEIRNMIRFAPFNLLTEKYPFQYPFDIVFCRNVLIYFDRPTAEFVIERMSKTLRPGGLLFLGHSETGMMRTKLLQTVSSAVYKKMADRV